MQAGTLTKWYVKPGDTVKRGDVIAVVETDKANVDVESFDTGLVERLLVQPGDKVPVGTALAYILSDGEKLVAPREAARIYASPAARKLARETGVELKNVSGSGPHGVIERRDVEKAALVKPAVVKAAPPQVEAAPAARPAPVEGLSGIRRAIAAAMAKSNREIPHYYLQTRIDMRAALQQLEQRNLQRPIQQRILPAAMLLKAVAIALAKVPDLNGYWIDDRPQLQEGIHIGMAIALRQGGLVIPAIHDVDVKSLDEIMEAMRDLITRARAGRLKSSEITDATVTVSNLGDLGVETVYGIIYPPQIALIGFGKIADQPWAHEGMIGVRPIVSATLAGDHRASDGHRGARFLTELDNALQTPEAL